MDAFEIQPYLSVGAIPLNASRDHILNQLSPEQIVPLPFLEPRIGPIDACEDWGIFINYDDALTSETIEMFEPAHPILEGIDLLSMPYSDLEQWVSRQDPDMVSSDLGFTSFKFGFSAYAPFKEEDPYSPCESVTFFRKEEDLQALVMRLTRRSASA
ncbi:hypothetical protein [Pontibacter sp. G13]|uniref:hypothetical protein n=1 Tax=Pontibacter sp. G13 TaxID=3074898 RepID=UPI00288B93E6|nr:hypothetical protein [Pontibacter sp. G13]WNJ18987.1 hypothetical protein RJD25_00730 [Pontibacter sp. G13]